METSQLLARSVLRLLKEKGWTQKYFAEVLGLDPPQITRMVQGKYQPRGDTLAKVAEAFGIPVAELLTTELAKKPKHGKLDPVKEADSSKIRRVPDLGWVGAGLRIDPMTETSEFVEVAGLPPGDFVSFRVKGDSMRGHLIGNGFRIVVRVQPGAESGEEVVACIEGQYLLKTLKIVKGKRWLYSADGETAPIDLDRYGDGDVQIIGVLDHWKGTTAKPRKRK